MKFLLLPLTNYSIMHVFVAEKRNQEIEETMLKA